MNTSSISRRQLLRAGAVAAAAQFVLRPARLFAAEGATATLPPVRKTGNEPLYSFVLLGDMHYDAMEHHDLDWVRKDKGEGDIRQINNYTKLSAEHTPKLMRRVKQLVEQSAAPTAFIIQNGDFVEGLCGSYELAEKQFNDATSMVDKMEFGVPFLVGKGNHDITGPGAPEAFDKVLLPWVSKQAGVPITSASRVTRHDDDAFIFFDAYKPDVDWLAQALKENSDARHTFFFTHPPVVPSDARANWCLFGFPREAESRKRVLEMLGGRGAMVFSGHLHKHSFIERQTSSGTFWEMGTCSVVRSDPTKPARLLDGVAAYGEQMTDLEPKFTPSTLEERKKLLREEQPFVRQYSLADAPGCTLVSVYADRIRCESFAGAAEDAWDTREVNLKVRA